MLQGWVLVALILVVLVQSQAPPESQLPEDFIVDVEQTCGSEGTNTTLTVTTDLRVVVKLVCKGSHEFDFITLNDVTYLAFAHFGGNETEKCVYEKREGTSTYAVEVLVNVNEGSDDVGINREARYTMTCTYDERGDKLTNNASMEEQFHGAREVQSIIGAQTNYSVSVFLTDILGRPIRGDEIPIDKYLCLKVLLDNSTGLLGDPNTISIYPLSCEAIGSQTGHRHALLRAGCGDGMIFRKDAGFSMRPRVAISPYFRFFHLQNDKTFSISCNFTLCSNCVFKNSCSGLDKDKSIFELFGKWIKAGNRIDRPPKGGKR